jgi:hypothetical protein
MKKGYILSFVAALLFAVAAVLSFTSGYIFRGIIGSVGAMSFLLSGIHWRRKSGNRY